MKSLNIDILPLSERRIDTFEIYRKLVDKKYFKNADRPTIGEKITFCCEYCDIEEAKLQTVSVDSINSLFATVAQTLCGHIPRTPKKHITVDGNKYRFVKRFSEQSAAWHELVRRSNFLEDPIQMAALCYIESGMKYAQKGDHDKILNPTAERANVFRENFPFDLYLDLSAFFLQKLKEYHPLSIKMTEARTMITAKMIAKMKAQTRQATRPMK